MMMKYLCDPHVIPTVVPRDFAAIESYAAQTPYAEELHVDVADGVFAPNTTWPFIDESQGVELDASNAAKRVPNKRELEIHMMIAHPREWGARFARAGFATIVGHIEAFESAAAAKQALDEWRAAGAKTAGLAISLATPLETLEGAIDSCDIVHMMSIEKIGFQGQPFDERALHRVEDLHAKYPDMLVSVDGGVSEATVEDLVRAGANRMTVGAALSQSANPADTYARILDRAMKGCAPPQEEIAL